MEDVPGSDEKIVEDEEQPALFEIEKDWTAIWQGMPEYAHEDLMPWQSIKVHFKTKKDRQDFADLLKQRIHASTEFVWFPKVDFKQTSSTKSYVDRENLSDDEKASIVDGVLDLRKNKE